MKGFPLRKAGQMPHSILLPGSPCNDARRHQKSQELRTDAWRHQEKTQELRTDTEGHEMASVQESGRKHPWSAPQLQPGPLAAGIQYSTVEGLPLPSAMSQHHTAGQSLSQDISLFPRHAITSLFLPGLKHTVLASVCSLKCQVPSLWHHK